MEYLIELGCPAVNGLVPPLRGFECSLLQGAWMTVKVALVSLAVATALGIVGALARLSANRVARGTAWLYTTIVRGIPDLVMMFMLFFGLQVLVNDLGARLDEWGRKQGHGELVGYIDIDPFTAGVLTIGLIFGAYMTETFRGAVMAIPKGQIEAGVAYGMSRPKVFRRIVFPQMARYALPAFGNNWLVLVKTTALVSVINLDDIMRKASLAGGSTREPFTFLLAAAALFLAIAAVSSFLLRWAERRYSAGVREAR